MSDKIGGEKDFGPNTEDMLIGVLAALVGDKEATVDEIKATLEKFKDPGAFEKFIGRLEQEINDDEDSKDDVKKEIGGDKKPPFGGGDKKPPFNKPTEKIDSDDTMGKMPDEKSPITAQLKEPAEEDARAYFSQLFPADFVNGLFAGSGKAVVAALKMIEKISGTNKELLEERAKIIQAKRVDTVLESMYRKGVLRTIDDVMHEDGVLEAEAKRVVTGEYNEKKTDRLGMGDEAFGQYVTTIEGMRDRSDFKYKSASANTGFRMIPDIKSGSDPKMIIASQDEVVDSLFSRPSDITEESAYISAHKSGERAAKEKIRQAQFSPAKEEDSDLTSALAGYLTGAGEDESDDIENE